jgi:hypothetical protein
MLSSGYPERIGVAAEGQIVCERRRIIERSITCRGEQSMNGATTSQYLSASQVPFATERFLLNCQRPLVSVRKHIE